MGKGEVYAGFRWGNLRERDYFEDPDADGMLLLNRYLRYAGRGGRAV
jgi:hypothetical protein